MRYLVSVLVGMLVGTLAGGLVGYGLQLASGQEGWTIVIGALGMCAGALLAGFRRADRLTFWSGRPGSD